MCGRRRTAFNWFVDSEKISLGYITYNNTRTEFFFFVRYCVADNLRKKIRARRTYLDTRRHSRHFHFRGENGSKLHAWRGTTCRIFSARRLFFFFIIFFDAIFLLVPFRRHSPVLARMRVRSSILTTNKYRNFNNTRPRRNSLKTRNFAHENG